jgi:hypothetical protein
LWKVSYGGDGVSYGGLLKMREKMGEGKLGENKL